MKKIVMMVLVIAILAVSQPGYGILIEKIVIEQVSSVTADFVEADGTLYFTGGASGYMVTETLDIVPFVDGTVDGEISGCVDTSSGGVASAEFSAGFLSMHLEGAGGPGQYVDMTVSLKPFFKYNTNETTAASDPTTLLNGGAWVVVDEAFFSDGWLSDGLVYEWADAIGETSFLMTKITLPYGINITDFLSDYSTNDTMITLYKYYPPEPCSLLLMGLGCLFLRKRR